MAYARMHYVGGMYPVEECINVILLSNVRPAYKQGDSIQFVRGRFGRIGYSQHHSLLSWLSLGESYRHSL